MNKHEFTNSSSIRHCDYHEKDGLMEICFTSGGTYHYKCDRSVYEALKAAKSPGSHFHTTLGIIIRGLKSNGYMYTDSYYYHSFNWLFIR